MEIFRYLLILLSSSIVFIVICHKLKFPPIIGYLIVGVLVGPGGLGWLPSIEDLHFLSEFGIVFLMFTLGLEFSLPKLFAIRKSLLCVGGTQVFFSTGFFATLAYLYGLDIEQSIILGGAISLSSTAIVIKQLSEQKEQHTPAGKMTINILLFQDIAAVLFLILIPAMANSDGGSAIHITFLLTIAKGVGVSIGLAAIGLWLLRPMFHEVAKTHSTELFMLTTLFVSLSAAGITYAIGLSMALGAFLAGLMLGETEFKNQIEMDIKPFRDALLGLFFVVIGAYLDVSKLPLLWPSALSFLIIILTGKGLMTFIAVKFFGRISLKCALSTSFILAHGGEFTFVLLSEAIDAGLLAAKYRPLIFSGVVLSVFAAPIMTRYHRSIVNWILLDKHNRKEPQVSAKLTEHAKDLANHVIICGYGRVGQILSRFLDKENIPWLALDLDPIRLSKAQIAGEHSFYGNATNPEALIAAGLAKARMVVVAFGNEYDALETLTYVRSMRLDLPIFIRTKDDSNLEAFQKAGATEVVPESLEGSIMLASHLLLTLGVPTYKVMDKVRKVHANRYDMLKGIYAGYDDTSSIENRSEARRSLHSIYITEDSYAVGKNLDHICPPESSIIVRSLTRCGKRISDIDMSMILNESDVLVILATPEEAVTVEDRILTG